MNRSSSGAKDQQTGCCFRSGPSVKGKPASSCTRTDLRTDHAMHRRQMKCSEKSSGCVSVRVGQRECAWEAEYAERFCVLSCVSVLLRRDWGHDETNLRFDADIRPV